MIKLWEDYKAWRRGEKRIKGAVRGRCFEPREGAVPKGGAHVAKSTANPRLVGIKVIRKDGTTEEIL
jgi:hypothetical protein